MVRRVLFALMTAVLSAPVGAQTRDIPESARAGVLRHISGPEIEIDGRRAHLAPGAQIRDTANRIVLPISLTQPVLIFFTLDALGHVHRAWIPTAEERARFSRRTGPGSRPY